MKIFFQILFNGFLLYYVAKKIYFWFFVNKKLQNKKDLRKYLLHYTEKQLKINFDLFTKAQSTALYEINERVRVFDCKNENIEILKKLNEKFDSIAIAPKRTFMYEIADTMVVAFAIAFGVRALFFQPFMIPTGSMQPTLYGIHQIDGGNEKTPNYAEKFFNYINYSYRYGESPAIITGKIVYDGTFNLGENRNIPAVAMELKSSSSSLTYETSIVNIILQDKNKRITQELKLPGDFKPASQYDLALYLAKQSDKTFKKGENIVNQRHVTGDYLFVDRVTLRFRNPQRGDITVFVTDGFPAGTMAGRYYIKRLVGMPGDTLKIVDGKLYAKEKDSTEFRLIAGEDNSGFAAMYSQKNGYRGYTNEGCFSPRYDTYNFSDDGKIQTYNEMPFIAKNQEFSIPEDFYFMMGDNSHSSRDSRYFGPIPRENIVGRAFFCWWPFSERWGVL